MYDSAESNSVRPLSRISLNEIVARAVNAPSGDNSQPWRFRVDNDSIMVLNLPNADSTLYNFRQRGSYFAHGAVIENLSILAAEQGYHLNVTLFPGTPDVTARVSFVSGGAVVSPLATAIEKRATNRKPYKRIPIEASDRVALLDAVKGREGVELRLAEGEDNVAILGRTVSTNERLLMENRTLHDFLFGIIRWTPEEERAKPGLYVKTMEFPPPVQLIMRYVLRHWRAVWLLNFIGLSRFIPLQSTLSYRASSAFGAIVISGTTNTDFVSAGRAFQRLWLTATERGMSIQPVTAIPYLMQRVVGGEASAFSLKHQKMIRKANGVISGPFHLEENENIAMLFRIGYGDKPTATSAKIPPIILES